MPKALVNFAIYCLLGAIVWVRVIIFVTIGSGLSDGAGNQLTSSGFAALCAPSLFLLLLFIASFRFIPLWPVIAILVVAAAFLLMFIFSCSHLGKMTGGTAGETVGVALACVFTAIGVAGHRLLWNDKRRKREE
jgi:hypothetical protein